ncbi:MAG: membrane protein insertase YidC [Lautropia sp.]|nr:membrane protein insertase YidC [Lautropia sp.]
MQQTQKTILWVIFIMSLLFLWDNWQKHNGQPSMFGGQSAQTAQQTQQAANGASNGSAGAEDATLPGGPTTEAGSSGTVANVPAVPAAKKGEIIRLTNDVINLDIDTVGGQISRSELLQHVHDTTNPDSGNLVIQSAEKDKFFLGQTGLVGVSGAPNHTTPMTVVRTMETNGVVSGVVLAAEGGGLRVERSYQLQPGSYEIKVDNKVTNVGEQPLSPTLYMQLTRDTHTAPGQSGFYSTYVGPVVYTDEDKFQKVAFDDIEKGKARHSVRANDGWVGIIQHYFVSAWVPKQGVSREYYTRRSGNGVYSIGAYEPVGQIAAGQTAEVSETLFIGPQDQNVLEKVAPGLDLVVDYGWLTAIAKPLFWLLTFLHGIVGNWGWAIVLLTIIVKLAFFPLQAASYRSMAKMRKVQPKLTAIRERYGDDRMKMNQAMMELYKTEKINPLGGCLPILVQIPVFIALYWVLLASVEIRNAPWIGWIKDLSSPDPWYILPVLMAVTMFIQTKLNPTPADPVQAKMMMWMPVIFSVMFFFFPAGLVLYWVVSNIFSIAQQWVITRRIEGKPLFGRAG